MAVVSYEVGALFTIEDNASGVLQRLSEQFAALDESVNALKANLASIAGEGLGELQGSITRLTEAFGGLTDEARAFGEGLTQASGAAASAATEGAAKIGTAYEEAFARATEAAKAFGTSAAETGAASAAAAGSAGRRAVDEDMAGGALATAAGGKGGGGGGGHGGILSGIMPLAEALSFAASEKTAMSEDLALRQTLIGMNINPDNPEGQKDLTALRSLAQESTKGTIFSEAVAAKAMVETAPLLGFSGQEGMEKFAATFPVALRLGELSKMRGKGALGSEAVAGEEFAHLTDQYDPAGLEKELDLVNAIAKRADTSITRQLSIMKYGLPVAMAAGIDPNRAAAEMGASEQILGPTSTVGTGYSQMLLSVLKSGGGINAHLSKHAQDTVKHMEHEFEQTLKLNPKAEKDYKEHSRGSIHDDAMKAFGFTEQSVAEAKRKGNLDQFIEHQIHAYSETHTDTFQQLINVMGVRGARYAEHYMAADALTRQDRYVKGVTGALPVRGEQDTLAKAPMQQFEQVLANINNIGNTLATATLPGLNSAFKVLNDALSKVNDWLHNHPTASTAIGYAAEGGLALGALNLLRGVASKGLGLVRGGVSAAGSVTETAASMLGGELLGAAPGIGALGWTAYEAKHFADQGSDRVEDWIFGAGHAERGHKLLEQAGANTRSILFAGHSHNGENRAEPGTIKGAPPGPAAPANVQIHLGPITMNGVADDHTFHEILGRLTTAMKQALSHASGTGQGSDQTPFVFGGT